MILLKAALTGLIAALSVQHVNDAVATVVAEKDKVFADYHDKVKASYNTLVDAIRSNDLAEVSDAAQSFEDLIGEGDDTQSAHAEAAESIVNAVIAPPPDAPEELGAANAANDEDQAKAGQEAAA